MPSYLQEVKDELCELTDTLRNDVEEGLGEEIPEMTDMFDTWKKEMWKTVERRLKQSFTNGREGADQSKGRFNRKGGGWR